MCGVVVSREDESTMHIYEHDIRTYIGETHITIPYLHILKNKKLRRENRKAERLKKQAELIVINEDKSQDSSEMDIEEDDKPIQRPKKIAPLIQAQKTLRQPQSMKPEIIMIPNSDPHPVKVGHNLLIETSFEEKESEMSEEELIGYQKHKNPETHLIDTLDMAVERYYSVANKK